MSGVIHIEAGRSFPVSARDGFDYITDPRNWIEYWPRAVSVDPDTRWRQPGDHARVAGFEIRVLAEQAFRRHRQVFSSGGLTIDLRSSQSGTGNFFERKKSGLNSFY